jgi:hypothetical protein
MYNKYDSTITTDRTIPKVGIHVSAPPLKQLVITTLISLTVAHQNEWHIYE